MSDDEPAVSAPAVSPRGSLLIACAVAVSSSAALGYAFAPARAGSPSTLWALGGLYAVFAAGALARLYRRGELQERLRPARGDITLAALTAGVLYGAGRIVLSWVASRGTPREAWLMRLYLQLGDPEARGYWMVGVAVFGIAALEEVVWRGLVMRAIEDGIGPRRGLVYSSLIYAAAHVPTAYLLRAPGAPPNPLLVLAALVCGLAWGAMAQRTGRLSPSVLSHALFSWSVIELPLWRL